MRSKKNLERLKKLIKPELRITRKCLFLKICAKNSNLAKKNILSLKK